MSRRRKKKKAQNRQQTSKPDPMPTPKNASIPKEDPPSEMAESATPEPAAKPVSKPKAEATESVSKPQTKPDAKSIIDTELDLAPDEYFDENSSGSSEKKVSLPSPEEKTQKLRKTAAIPAATDSSQKSPLNADDQSPSPSNKRDKMRKNETTLPSEDELGDLDDYLEEEITETPEELEKKPKEPKALSEDIEPPSEKPSDLADEENPKSVIPGPNEPIEQKSILETLKEKLFSLSLIEQVSIGLMTLILVVAAFWSINVVSARIPSAVETSQLKFPYEGQHAVLASLETYWRSPIREGEDADEGVRTSIELIPEVKIALDPSSKAKALRFLFRDEEGRYVGDASTIRASKGKFQTSDVDTATSKGSSAIVHCTTGFHHEGELISYLADDEFRWEIVVFESKDGTKFKEFLAFPISAIRNDKS